MQKKASIMIVEDDSFIAEDIRQILINDGYEVIGIIPYGEIAVDKAHEDNPDLILMDIKLPGTKNGIEASEEINKSLKIPIIYLTAHSDTSLVSRLVKTNPFGYVLKPFNERELLVAIEIALYKHTINQELVKTNKLLQKEISLRENAEKELREYKDELEVKVKERTSELEKSKKELQQLADHLQTVREEERVMIAREIHDELGQYITALNIDMNWLKNKITDNELFAKINNMITMIDTIMDITWRISSELRPSTLDELGFIAAIEWYCQEIEKKSNIACQFLYEPEEIFLDEKKSLQIFRIVQESLTNVLRHSKSSKTFVNISLKGGTLKVQIKDNGIGIDEKKLTDSKSFGLIGMKERVNSLGGDITITGVPNKGTTIDVTIQV